MPASDDVRACRAKPARRLLTRHDAELSGSAALLASDVLLWRFIMADDLPLSAAPKSNPQTATRVWPATAAVNGILLVWTSTPPIPAT
jgi:hypothetical protein